jgi:O-antigen ligase
MIYSETAFNTYASSPFLGVGPGNYALLFADMLPNRPLARTPEVLRLVTPEEGRDRLVTAKNFGLRLLAETGVLGTAAFLAFLIAILGSVFFLWLSPHPDENFWGIGGILALAAFLLSTLSFDSFAVPNMWVIFGFITAASVLARYPHSVKDQLPSEKLLV